MKFFFPDSQDLVDPSFDFTTETRSETRLRHRDRIRAEVTAKETAELALADFQARGQRGNIFVVEWVTTGRVTFLRRVG